MIRCATMQYALQRYMSSKYYYSILSMMMMPKEGMVCFIVFFDNKNIWFCEKSSLYLNYWESYDNFIDFLAAILNFSFQKTPLRRTALHRPRYHYGGYPCTIKRETNFYQQKQGCPHEYRGYPHDHIDFTDKNTKKILCTLLWVYSGSATGGHLLPPSILGGRV